MVESPVQFQMGWRMQRIHDLRAVDPDGENRAVRVHVDVLETRHNVTRLPVSAASNTASVACSVRVASGAVMRGSAPATITALK